MSGKRIVLLAAALLMVAISPGEAKTFTVTTTGDQADPVPGDDVCGITPPINKGDPSSGPCTLRAAIQTANANSTTDIIQFGLSSIDPNCANGVCTITASSELPSALANLTINGPGAGQLIVRNPPQTLLLGAVLTSAASGTVTISGLTVRDGLRGGISHSGTGTLNVTNCTVRANGGSAGRGGAISNQGDGTVNVNSCLIADNSAFDAGGGLYTDGGPLNINRCTIINNHSIGNTSHGGGVANFTGPVTITDSTISGNSAKHAGGGVSINGVKMTNSTIAGNSVAGGTGAIGGGGVYSYTTTITNCTITGNSAQGSGGGVLSRDHQAMPGLIFPTTTLKSSIVAGNTATGSSPDVSAMFITGGFNLIGKINGSTGLTHSTDMSGTVAAPLDAKLDPAGLKDNGGPTQTVALLFGSPAIDKATSVPQGGGPTLTTDQRGAGFPRTVDDPALPNANGGDGTDVGAFEMPAAAPTPTPTPTPVTTLANISTRLRVETGDNVLIGGFIITGTEPKKVIIRGIGTSLPLADKLSDPTLELHGPNGLIEANDNWVDSPNKQAIIDSTIPPSNDFESAIVQTLAANNAGYTAIVRGVNGGTGIGVVEAYDLDTAANSRLANISTRGFVQTGDNVLIAGTIVVGQVSQNVIIRAIGPSLPIAGKMENPTLELRDSNGGVLQANDNWVDSPNKQQIIDTTIPPSHDLESAIVATLPAQNASYTAIVRGVNDTTGIAVVEVYALP